MSRQAGPVRRPNALAAFRTLTGIGPSGRAAHDFHAENPNSVNPDWPFRGIDHVLVRCGGSGGPSLPIRSCCRIFDQGATNASDHYGLTWPSSTRR